MPRRLKPRDPHAIPTEREVREVYGPRVHWVAPERRDEQPEPDYRHRWFVEEDETPLPVLFDAEGYPVIFFAPVPLLRRRRDGWDETTQRRFIAQLARTPSVTRSARAIGRSARSAYALLDKPGAEPFAKAWDIAFQFGLDRIAGDSLQRCLGGPEEVRVMRRGKHVRTEFRHNDKLAVALLLHSERNVDDYRRGAQVRWRQTREREKREDEKRAKEEARQQAIVDYRQALADFIAANTPPRIGPRIRSL